MAPSIATAGASSSPQPRLRILAALHPGASKLRHALSTPSFSMNMSHRPRSVRGWTTPSTLALPDGVLGPGKTQCAT